MHASWVRSPCLGPLGAETLGGRNYKSHVKQSFKNRVLWECAISLSVTATGALECPCEVLFSITYARNDMAHRGPLHPAIVEAGLCDRV